MRPFLDRFCESTAIHGFSQFQRQKHLLSRLVWFVVLFLVFSLLTCHLVLLVGQYLQYDYTEKIKFSDDHVFPDIIICPLAQSLHSGIFQKSSGCTWYFSSDCQCIS